MARPANPTISRRELANTLRLMRLRARKTLEEAASALESSAATMSRIETGIRVPRARDVKDLCVFYGVTDAHRVAELTALVADAKETGWWEGYSEVDEAYATFIAFEAAATAIEQFESVIVPAILQTPAYGDAYLRGVVSPSRTNPLSEHDIVKRLEVRLRRQQLLTAESGFQFIIILDEAVLLRMVGGPAVMRGQVKHLLEAAERAATEILVLPLEHGAHPGQTGAFTLLTLPQTQVSDVVYIDSNAGQLFLESPEELERHRRIFTALRSAALNASDSKKVLHAKMTGY